MLILIPKTKKLQTLLNGDFLPGVNRAKLPSPRNIAVQFGADFSNEENAHAFSQLLPMLSV